jgi:hypothetical protein
VTREQLEQAALLEVRIEARMFELRELATASAVMFQRAQDGLNRDLRLLIYDAEGDLRRLARRG